MSISLGILDELTQRTAVLDQCLNRQPCACREGTVNRGLLTAGWLALSRRAQAWGLCQDGRKVQPPAPGDLVVLIFAWGVPRALGTYLAFTFTPTCLKSQTLALHGSLSLSRPEGRLGGHSHACIFSRMMPVPCHFRCNPAECTKVPGFRIWPTTIHLCASVPSSVKWGW